MMRLPQSAEDWVISYVNLNNFKERIGRKQPMQPHVINGQNIFSLDSLNVREVKTLANDINDAIVYHARYVDQTTKILASNTLAQSGNVWYLTKPGMKLNKATFIKYIVQCFYRDQNCTEPADTRVDLIWKITNDLITIHKGCKVGRMPISCLSELDTNNSQSQNYASNSSTKIPSTINPQKRMLHHESQNDSNKKMTSSITDSNATPSINFKYNKQSHEQTSNPLSPSSECFDLVTNPYGIPQAEMKKLQMKSKYGSHTSKLAYMVEQSHINHVKIKQEKISFETDKNIGALSSSFSTATTTAASTTINDITPANYRESEISQQLKNMGFTDMREILTAVRHVESSSTTNSTTSDQSNNIHCFRPNIIAQVDAAMIWILTQREEAEEARKMDAARLESLATRNNINNNGSHNVFQSNIDNDQTDDDDNSPIEMVTIEDMFGLGQKPSPYFPSSTLLQSQPLQKIFFTLSKPPKLKNTMKAFVDKGSKINISFQKGRKIIMHLLNLEKNAYKWYGNKIPYPFFQFSLRPRLEKSIKKIKKLPPNATSLDVTHQSFLEMVQKEIMCLEEKMFSLSDQVEADLGLMVPKFFLEARDEAIKNGNLIDQADSEVIILDGDDDD